MKKSVRPFNGYLHGVNLGGWLSQYHEFSKAHFDSFITEPDIALIRGMGLDHVRIPVDYPVLDEYGFEYLDRALEWCRSCGVNMIIDLHRARGYSFSTLSENKLFDDEALKAAFVSDWVRLAGHFKDAGDEVTLELLNEIVDRDGSRWNELAKRTVGAIREVDKTRRIIVGGNNYNSIGCLDEICDFDDENVVYTFHFYLPFPLTHQKASWSAGVRDYGKNIDYPSDMKPYLDFCDFAGWSKDDYLKSDRMDINWLEKALAPALDFLEKRGGPVYCGEYGVIDNASLETRENWHRDINILFEKYGIGRAVWSYKRMSFKLVESEGEKTLGIVSRKLSDAVAGRV